MYLFWVRKAIKTKLEIIETRPLLAGQAWLASGPVDRRLDTAAAPLPDLPSLGAFLETGNANWVKMATAGCPRFFASMAESWINVHDVYAKSLPYPRER